MTSKFTELPELQGVANDLGDLFVPDDAEAGTVTIRRGRIKAHHPERIVDCVLVFDNDREDNRMHIFSRETGKEWAFHSGFTSLSENAQAAVKHVLGYIPGHWSKQE